MTEIKNKLRELEKTTAVSTEIPTGFAKHLIASLQRVKFDHEIVTNDAGEERGVSNIFEGNYGEENVILTELSENNFVLQTSNTAFIESALNYMNFIESRPPEISDDLRFAD